MSEEAIKTYDLQDWIDEGNVLFGLKIERWRFICPMCGHVQGYEDFEERTELRGSKIFKVLGFSCIGRFLTDQVPKKEKDNDFPIKMMGGGCNWTLGGLFSFHKVEVIGKNGNVEPIFEFAKGGKHGRNEKAREKENRQNTQTAERKISGC